MITMLIGHLRYFNWVKYTVEKQQIKNGIMDKRKNVSKEIYAI